MNFCNLLIQYNNISSIIGYESFNETELSSFIFTHSINFRFMFKCYSISLWIKKKKKNQCLTHFTVGQDFFTLNFPDHGSTKKNLPDHSLMQV